MDEFSFISTLLAPLARADAGALGLEDDAALLSIPAGHEHVVIARTRWPGGVHFIGNEPASLIARKLRRVNLSDLAAMGATPQGAIFWR